MSERGEDGAGCGRGRVSGSKRKRIQPLPAPPHLAAPGLRAHSVEGVHRPLRAHFLHRGPKLSADARHGGRSLEGADSGGLVCAAPPFCLLSPRSSRAIHAQSIRLQQEALLCVSGHEYCPATLRSECGRETCTDQLLASHAEDLATQHRPHHCHPTCVILHG